MLISTIPVYGMSLDNSDPDLSPDPTINSPTGYTGSNPSGPSCSGINTFAKFVGCIQNVILQPLVFLLFAVAIVYFLYGVLTYIREGGDEDTRRAGRDMMVYGIIAIAVMLSVIGLVSVLVNSFNFNQGATLNNQIPSLPQK